MMPRVRHALKCFIPNWVGLPWLASISWTCWPQKCTKPDILDTIYCLLWIIFILFSLFLIFCMRKVTWQACLPLYTKMIISNVDCILMIHNSKSRAPSPYYWDCWCNAHLSLTISPQTHRNGSNWWKGTG